MDSFTETRRTGFFSRIKNAIVGAFIGMLLVPGSIILLSWNEYRTIHRTHGLNEGAELVETVADPNSASQTYAGKLIHVNEKADTEERLRDDVFGIEENAIRLVRNVEMYQWVEDKRTEKSGNTKKTVYEYRKEWRSGREDHQGFKKPNGHENPRAKFRESTHEAKRVNVGAYVLNQNLKSSIRSGEGIDWDDERLAALSPEVRDNSVVDGRYLYWSETEEANPVDPLLGDQRIWFSVVRPTRVSFVAESRQGDPASLKPFTTTNGEELEKLYVGDFSAAEVFEKMQGENEMWAWILRAGGFAVSFIGFAMILGVLSAFTDWIPLVGSMTRGLVGLVALLLAVVLTSLTIAFAWIAVRPLIAIPLIVVGIGAAVMAWRSSRKNAKNQPVYANTAGQAEAPAVLSADDVVQ